MRIFDQGSIVRTPTGERAIVLDVRDTATNPEHQGVEQIDVRVVLLGGDMTRATWFDFTELSPAPLPAHVHEEPAGVFRAVCRDHRYMSGPCDTPDDAHWYADHHNEMRPHFIA